MCGIVGAIAEAGESGLLDQVRLATRRLEHRGPDDYGTCTLDGPNGRLRLMHRDRPMPTTDGLNARFAVDVVLAHRRLSIIDLSANAAQPMTANGGRQTVIQNGEIYNYRTLQRELEVAGHTFQTTSDTEVLLAAWRQWGKAALLRLEGMFALAILDLDRGVLFLARDPFGIKPLYYASRLGKFAFASEIPALLQFPWVRRVANASRVFEHLNFWTTDRTDGTFVADIKTLPAAHYLELPLDAAPAVISPQRYWQAHVNGDADITFTEATGRLRALFLESVEQHLQADVPWCVALSGGTDSSSVTMAARRILGKQAPLHTVSFIANDPSLNEEIWIDTVVRAGGATAHKLQIADEDLGKDFTALVRLQGQPMVTPVVYAQHRVFRHAGACGFKVLLEGQGADELLAGYPFYLQARLASLLRRGQLTQAARFLWKAPPRFLSRRSYVLHHALDRAFPALRLVRPAAALAPWISRRWVEHHGIGHQPAPTGLSPRPQSHYLRAMIDDAIRETKLPSLLRYGDHNAMAASVENRVPFLTTKLVEFLLALPEEFIISPDGESKHVLRHAMKGITPEFVLRRKNKIGFEPPYQKWMQAMRPTLVDTLDHARALPVFDAAGLRTMAQQLTRDGVDSAAFANRLWRAACLTEWARQYDVSFAAN